MTAIGFIIGAFLAGIAVGALSMARTWVPLYHKHMFRAWKAEDALHRTRVGVFVNKDRA